MAPLHWAAFCGHKSVITRLVDANASLQTTKEGYRLVGPLVGAALFFASYYLKVDLALSPGDALSWTSDGMNQGSVGCDRMYCHDNGCAAKGTCGAPYSQHGLGGGWQLCLATGPGCTNQAFPNFDPTATAKAGAPAPTPTAD